MIENATIFTNLKLGRSLIDWLCCLFHTPSWFRVEKPHQPSRTLYQSKIISESTRIFRRIGNFFFVSFSQYFFFGFLQKKKKKIKETRKYYRLFCKYAEHSNPDSWLRIGSSKSKIRDWVGQSCRIVAAWSNYPEKTQIVWILILW